MTTKGDVKSGVVSEFDERRGLGEVVDDAGSRWAFHCTQIADGSRRIEAGSRVLFVLVPGHLGRLEAQQIMTSGPATPTPAPATSAASPR